MRQPASHYDASQYDERESGYGQGYGLVGEERAAEPPPRNRRVPAILLTLGVMALFVGGLWFAYVQGTKHAQAPAAGSGDAAPLIRADERPTKIKPDQPGGMAIPDQNVSLYNDKPGKPQLEKLLPGPEQPIARPAAPPPPPAKEAAAPAPAAPPPAAEHPPQLQPPLAGAAKPAIKPPIEPKPPAQPKPAAPAAATPVSTGAAAGGPVQIRLGSLRTPEAAREEWARIKREHADLLGDLKANAVPIDLGEKGVYYRIVAGPLADAAAAERLCGELKRRNRGCILAR